MQGVPNIRGYTMHMITRSVCFLLSMSILGCSGSEQINVESERQAIFAADREWAAAARAGDVEKLASFWSDDAINFFPNQPAAIGKAAIGGLVRTNRSRAGFSLSWEPQEAVVAASGDIGYSYGTFQLSFENGDNEQVSRHGHYVCIWKKQVDGSWKCGVESTIFGPPQEQVPN
jgi:ketosteroid isomerase-like protein